MASSSSSSAAPAPHEELAAVEDRHSEFDAALSYPPPPQSGPYACDAAAYQAGYARSIADPDGFWAEHGRATLTWFRDFKEVRGGSFQDGDVRWFAEGQLNVCYNCVDRACTRVCAVCVRARVDWLWVRVWV